LAESDSDSEPKLPELGVYPDTFAVIDTDRREQAIGVLNVNILVRATEHVEEEDNKPEAPPPGVIVNSAAIGLQMLAEATETHQQNLTAPISIDPAHGHMSATLPPYHSNALPEDRMAVDIISPTKPTDGQGTTSSIAQ
jgi:hypothetical protein